MDELSQEAVEKFWDDCPDPAVKQVIHLMESAETWISESPELSTQLEKLGPILSQNDAATKLNLTDYPAIIQLISSLKLGRALRCMQLLDNVTPGTAIKSINYADQHPDDAAAKILVQRNVILERLRILYHVFALERLNHLTKFMESNNATTN